MIEYKSYDYTRTIPVDDYILRADWINVFLRWRRNIMGGRFMPVVVYFALGKSVHVDLVRLAATPCGFVVPLRPVGSIWDVLPRSCSV